MRPLYLQCTPANTRVLSLCKVGDFAKYSLLTALAEADLRLGVIRYLNTLQESNNDGGITDYPALRNCNERIHAALQHIFAGWHPQFGRNRAIRYLAPEYAFFSRPLPASPQRQSWLAEAAEAVREVSTRVGRRTRCSPHRPFGRSGLPPKPRSLPALSVALHLNMRIGLTAHTLAVKSDK
jgi:hypothetical protein